MIKLVEPVTEEIIHPKDLKFGQIAEIVASPETCDIHNVVQRDGSRLFSIGGTIFYGISGLSEDFKVRVLKPGEQIKIISN